MNVMYPFIRETILIENICKVQMQIREQLKWNKTKTLSEKQIHIDDAIDKSKR